MQTPYYAEVLSAKGLIANDLLDPRVLAEFPIIQRNELASTGPDFLPDPWSSFPIYSTGTTGQPMRVFRSDLDNIRLWKIIRKGCGLSTSNKLNVLFLDSLKEGTEENFERHFGDLTLSISRVNLHTNPVGTRILLLQPFDLIVGSPSGVAWLLAENIVPIAKTFYTTALPLSQTLRQALTDRLGAKIFQCYSTTETGPVAFQCENIDSTYHVFSDYYVESKAGAILVTKMFASGMPLVRYQTGDQATLAHAICECGFVGSSLLNLRGRKSESSTANAAL